MFVCDGLFKSQLNNEWSSTISKFSCAISRVQETVKPKQINTISKPKNNEFTCNKVIIYLTGSTKCVFYIFSSRVVVT